MLSYVLLILLLTVVSLAGLLLMVRKFYWGRRGDRRSSGRTTAGFGRTQQTTSHQLTKAAGE
ncbi:MAG: hypothetical protein LC803_03895 [Acidobacteria bacterium]|nr:hypothetical protein [Acidobacteriota bacterium]